MSTVHQRTLWNWKDLMAHSHRRSVDIVLMCVAMLPLLVVPMLLVTSPSSLVSTGVVDCLRMDKPQ